VPVLPAGVELYRFRDGEEIELVTAGGVRRLDEDGGLLRFIDDGQRAHYLIGDVDSGPERPSHATVKFGIVAPHSAFRPHVHGAEHVVLSLGYGSCTLVERGRVVELALPPGHCVRIPAMVPHSFGNRAGQPLVILAANTGLGLADADYAVDADDAAARGWEQVAGELRLLDGVRPAGLRARERLAAGLRRVARLLEPVGPR
jgi:mannose-6-phosphate isomerase-like protein (cupin superfamily)